MLLQGPKVDVVFAHSAQFYVMSSKFGEFEDTRMNWGGGRGQPELLCPWLVYMQVKPNDAYVFFMLNYVLPPHSLLAVGCDLGGLSQTGHSQTVQTANLCMNVAPRMRV